MTNVSFYFCVVGASGIAQPSTSGPPVQSTDAAVAAYAVDVNGTITSIGSIQPWNVSTAEAVPASVPAFLGRSNNGNFYCTSWVGQANRGAVNPNVVYQMPNF